MNRLKKEEKRKHNEARQGLSIKEIEALNKKEEENNSVEVLAGRIHAEKFSEEYDFMYDSIIDAKDRSNGKNPMSEEYIHKINKKRADLGVSPLSDSGMPTSKDTHTMCIEEAREIIRKNTK